MLVQGLQTAFQEIMLVFFTTLAPAGAMSAAITLFPVVVRRLNMVQRSRVNLFLAIPLCLVMLGLTMSATHLGNPQNALYVFLHIGSSPLSNEVFIAALFLFVGGSYWFYGFAANPREGVQQIWGALTLVLALAFVAAMAFAYSEKTIISWNTFFTPLCLTLTALSGGPLLSLVVFRTAGTLDSLRNYTLGITLAALIASCCLFAVSIMQAMHFGTLSNSLASGAEIGLIVVAMSVISALFQCGASASVLFLLWNRRSQNLFILVAFCLWCLAGVFILRFSFYMMHMTVGLGL